MAMDLITSTITTITTTMGAPVTTITRTPDSDTETPPPPPPPKRPHHLQHAPPHLAVVSYKECMKNHAASIGGHALDGCCEFMPGSTANPSDPTSLKCAACGCHRNFHRRDPDDPAPLALLPRRPHSPSSASQLLLSLSGQGHGQGQDHGQGQNGNNKKRYRTKFSQEQKEKMYEFSKKIGWKLKKGEEKLVEEFCQNVGVSRTVFKVWMHNNKHSSPSVTEREKDHHLHDDQHDLHHLNLHHTKGNSNGYDDNDEDNNGHNGVAFYANGNRQG